MQIVREDTDDGEGFCIDIRTPEYKSSVRTQTMGFCIDIRTPEYKSSVRTQTMGKKAILRDVIVQFPTTNLSKGSIIQPDIDPY